MAPPKAGQIYDEIGAIANSSGGIVRLTGRFLLSLIFIFSGIGKIGAFSTYTGFVAAAHLPLPKVSITIAIIVELLGGLAIMTGLYARFAAWVVFLYLIPTTIMFHNFWTLQGAARMDNLIHFEKNFAIMGGLLILASAGAGAYSIDSARASRT
jgi:putative oxidoreductase